MDFFLLAHALISGVWKFYTSLSVPGLVGVTFASLLIAYWLAVLGIRLGFLVLGLSGGGDSPRTSSTSKPKISKERKHDEF